MNTLSAWDWQLEARAAFSEQLATKDEIKKVYENCKITKIG